MTIATRVLRAGGRDVPLLAGPGVLAELPRALSETGFEGHLWLIADEHAMALHGDRIQAVLPEVETLCVSGQEENKNLAQVARVWDWLVEHRAQRRDALVAFGGGVVCDLVGFAAASYMRGIGLVNAPTTLLAQVDAAVGGKTGVNHPRGKNLIGAFYQPMCVVADTSLLSSVPVRAFAAGMAEVVKMAMILDAQLFERLERVAAQLEPGQAEALAPFVTRSIELKAEVVERDEREAGDRMLLNYGHTIGHALEAVAGYGTVLHGEAVAIGMRGAAQISREMGLLSDEDARRQASVLAALNLPRDFDASIDDVLGRLSVDKKRAGARQRWVLAERIGAGTIRDDVPKEIVRAAVSAITMA